MDRAQTFKLNHIFLVELYMPMFMLQTLKLFQNRHNECFSMLHSHCIISSNPRALEWNENMVQPSQYGQHCPDGLELAEKREEFTATCEEFS